MPKNLALIPLRKGSKGIQNKNKRKIIGRPLFSWVLTEAIFSNLDKVVIFTDDEWIFDFVNNHYQWTSKVEAVLRSESSATDSASTEQAILEYCESIEYDFESFTLLQATSPFTSRTDINKSLELLKQDYDSALSVVRTHRFIWDENGAPINYNYYSRPRRQDFNGLLVENGAIYSTTKRALINSGTRISGKIGYVEMSSDSYHEIDNESDWEIVEKLLLNRQIKEKSNRKIKHLILDVDGVFTYGTITYDKNGEHTKEFDMRDGMGLEIIQEQGIEVRVLTSEISDLVALRMKKLQIKKVHLGVKDKFALLQYFINSENIDLSEVAYVGDDINDLVCMCSVGWSLAPNNATAIVKQYADIVLNKNSGSGAIREACDFLMNYNKRY